MEELKIGGRNLKYNKTYPDDKGCCKLDVLLKPSFVCIVSRHVITSFYTEIQKYSEGVKGSSTENVSSNCTYYLNSKLYWLTNILKRLL